MKKIKNILRNEKGLTLIELLAVVVILAIIAAIAIPSIGGVIDNTKKDAHIANAEQIINAARLNLIGDKALSIGAHEIPVSKLVEDGYLEGIKDPDDNKKGYGSKSKVILFDGKIVGIFLDGEKREVKLGVDAKKDANSSSRVVSIDSLNRADIK